MHLRTSLAAVTATGLITGLVLATPTGATGAQPPGAPDQRPTTKIPTAIGTGGAVTTVDPEASAAGLKVLKAGGNAVDAAVAAAATLGVTEPYSAGIGGGGYFVYYNAKTGKVRTLDGRETAPSKMPQDAFIDPATGKPYPFTPDLVTSGVSVGTPGTLATWDKALANWGTLSLGEALAPATKVATRGFKVDDTFRQQTLDNEERFRAFKDTKKLFLPGGDAPAVGSIFRNPDLAETYRADRREGDVRLLPRPARAADVRRRPQAPDHQEHRAADPEGLPHAARPARLQGALAARDEDQLSRPRRLRHGAVVVRRHHCR